MDSFPCTQCGLCCKLVGKVLDNIENLDPIRRSLADNFPYKPKDDGSCEMLSEDGLCTVYHDRPDICNISTVAKALNISLTDYYLQSAKNCNKLIILLGEKPEYLINLEQIR